MSSNLAWTALLEDQGNPEVAINDALGIMDRALTEYTSINLASGNVVVTALQSAVAMILATGAAVARDLTLPAVKRCVAVYGAATNAANVTVKRGATSYVLKPGKGVIVYLDGTTDGLYVVAKTGDDNPLPTGGTTGQALVKASGTDYDVEWDTIVGGGGGPSAGVLAAYLASIQNAARIQFAEHVAAGGGTFTGGYKYGEVTDMGGVVALTIRAATGAAFAAREQSDPYIVPVGCKAVVIGADFHDNQRSNQAFYKTRLANITTNTWCASPGGDGSGDANINQPGAQGWANNYNSGFFGTANGGPTVNAPHPVAGVAGDEIRAEAWSTGDGNYRIQGAVYYLAIIDATTNKVLPVVGTSEARSRLLRTTDQAVADSTWTLLTWDDADIDEGSAYDSGNPSRLIVPLGMTQAEIGLRISWAVSSTGKRHVQVRRNSGGSQSGGTAECGDVRFAADQSAACLASGPIDVTAGDYFEVFVWQSSGGASSIANDTGDYAPAVFHGKFR